MAAVFKREFGAYFKSPIGWVFLAIYYVFSGYFFWYVLSYNSADLSFIFNRMFIFTLFLIPVLTMRLMSDEKRLKTDQLLFTAPTSIGSVITGKFLAAFSVYSIAVSINVLYALVLSIYVVLDWMLILGNVLGALLLGAAFIAIGLLVSSLTESQLVSAVSTFGISLLLYLIDSFKGTNTSSVLYKVIDGISVNSHYEPFTKGLINYSDIIFFVSVAAIFIFLAVRLQERKRWS